MTRLREYLQENRKQIEEDVSPEKRPLLSPALYAQYRAVLPLLATYVRGRVIDLGCGNAPFKRFLDDRIVSYDTLDVQAGAFVPTYVADIQNMNRIPDMTYDSAIVLEVLEHVPNPFAAMREISRILKPGGTAVITVPHLSRLHDEPHDYYRFTKYALKFLCEESGLEVLELSPKAGVLSFLGHQMSSFCLSAVWPVPGLRQITWWINGVVTLTCYHGDRVIGGTQVLPLGYAAVARRQVLGGGCTSSASQSR